MVLQSVTPGTTKLAHRPFTEVMLRVTYQLVRYDLWKNPEKYRSHAPSAILSLSETLTGDLLQLRPFLHYYARNLAHGYTMRALRDNPPDYTLRSIAKLKPRSTARR